jgi:uncharacterized glyoxalase superfamily protein PhnB
MPSDRFVSAATNRSMPVATVIPILHYPDVVVAAAWLGRAFGFRERLRIGAHRVQIDVGSGAIVLAHGDASEADDSIMVRVLDADAHCANAVLAGATIVSPPTSMPYGERQYTAVDHVGRAWTFSQTEADVDPADWGGVLVR